MTKDLHTVIYIESSYQPEINEFIKSSYDHLIKLAHDSDVNFLYLPYLFQSPTYKEIIDYNYPFLNIDLKDIQIADIYSSIIQNGNLDISGGGFIFLKSYISDKIQAFKQIEQDYTLLAQLAQFVKEIQEINVEKPLRSSIVSKRIFTIDKEESIEYNRSNNVQFSIHSVETQELEFEIWQKIELLKEKGSLKFIGEIIEELQKVTQKISSLFITNDYRIFLKDYGMLEVLMPPLSKCLFFLFLNHPEGILFKKLSDYHDELLSIYRNVTVRENIDTAIDSIKALSNPLNNSVNEKASRIRAAFLELITDDLAKNYYITGYRGELKRIDLERSLVEYQE